MALTDTFVKSAKTTNKAGEKHSDGGGLYLLLKESGKYWRMNYRFGGKREKAKEQLAAGDDLAREGRIPTHWETANR